MAQVIIAEDGLLSAEDVVESKDPRVPRPSLVLSIETILISLFIFIAILSWVEFIRTLFDTIFASEEYNFAPIGQRFWYAIFITTLVLILIYIVYRMFNPCS